MIDINNVEKEFEKYVENYNPQNGRIKIKIEHTKRVAQNCKTIAQSLNLSEEEINLSIAIGYFHDIGRFEQVRIANTFSDKESGINHGEMAVKVLFENNFIRTFIETSEYDEIIKKAVINHNRAKIEENLSEKELLFAKIIRDADKIDILNSITLPEYSMESIFWYFDWNQNEINEELMNDFFTQHRILYPKINNNADVITIFYAYIFDLYFPISLKIISDNKYLDIFTQRVYETFPSQKIHMQTAQLLEHCNEFMMQTSQNT